MSAEGRVSATDSVRSAFAELEKGENLSTPAPASSDTLESPGAGVSADQGGKIGAEPAAKTAAERTRDEKGKFVKPGETKEVTEADPEKVVEAKVEQPGAPKINPPPNWKGGGKIKWEKLPRDIQQELVDDYKTRGEMQGKYEPLERVLGPRRAVLSATYGSEAQALQQLFALSDFAEKDPIGFLKFYAQQRGIDVSTLTGRPAAAQVDGTGMDQLPGDPRLQAMMGKLSGLEQQLTQFTQSQQTQLRSEAQRELDGFFSNPEYPYAQDVRSKMAVLLGNGEAKDLKDAYEQAVWMDGNIRKQLLEQQTQTQHSKQLEIANAAKTRASSVSGAPGGAGGTPKPSFGVPSGETPRDTVKRLMNEASARA